MTLQTRKITSLLFIGSFLVTPIAPAAAKRCAENIAKPSVYFVPHIRDYCPSLEPCDAFKAEVEDKGSGTLYGSKILNYLGKQVDIGTCDTAIGRRGTCLKPFVSVAADEDHYRMGDIIQVPWMKGKIIPLPNGKKLIHPGYFIVEDVGGGIQGKNRFDFFTGGFNAKDPRNAFGYNGELNMTDARLCDPRNQFKVVRRGTGSSYQAGLAAIEKSFQELGATRMVAGDKRFEGFR